MCEGLGQFLAHGNPQQMHLSLLVTSSENAWMMQTRLMGAAREAGGEEGG